MYVYKHMHAYVYVCVYSKPYRIDHGTKSPRLMSHALRPRRTGRGPCCSWSCRVRAALSPSCSTCRRAKNGQASGTALELSQERLTWTSHLVPPNHTGGNLRLLVPSRGGESMLGEQAYDHHANSLLLSLVSLPSHTPGAEGPDSFSQTRTTTRKCEFPQVPDTNVTKWPGPVPLLRCFPLISAEKATPLRKATLPPALKFTSTPFL